MTPIEIATLISIALKIGVEAFNFLSDFTGGKIPTYQELMAMNAEVQAMIEAEKG